MLWEEAGESPKWECWELASVSSWSETANPEIPAFEGHRHPQSDHFLHQNVGFWWCSKTAEKEIMPQKTPKVSQWFYVIFSHDLFALFLLKQKSPAWGVWAVSWLEIHPQCWVKFMVPFATVFADFICSSFQVILYLMRGGVFPWDKIWDLSEAKKQVLVKWVHSSPSELGSRLRDYWKCFHSFSLEHSHGIFNLWASFLSSAGIAEVCNDFFSFGAKVKYEFMAWLHWDFRTGLQKSKLLWSYLPGDYRQITLAKHPIPCMIYWAPEYFY